MSKNINFRGIIVFFAATTSLVANFLAWDSLGKRYSDPTGASVSGALMSWFFLLSLALWAIFIAVFTVQRIKNKTKRRKHSR